MIVVVLWVWGELVESISLNPFKSFTANSVQNPSFYLFIYQFQSYINGTGYVKWPKISIEVQSPEHAAKKNVVRVL